MLSWSMVGFFHNRQELLLRREWCIEGKASETAKGGTSLCTSWAVHLQFIVLEGVVTIFPELCHYTVIKMFPLIRRSR